MKQLYQPKNSSAGKNKVQKIIFFATAPSPIGPVVVCSTEKGICFLDFLNHRQLNPVKDELEKKLNGIIKMGENEHISQVKQELEEYFNGKRMQFTVPLYPTGTAFQLSVWNCLLDIPYGTTTTYLKQALSLGNPNAVRAVAAANARNKIALLIPCHRVIGSNGKLTGYAGGLERKKWLLDFENRINGAQYSLPFNEMNPGKGSH